MGDRVGKGKGKGGGRERERGWQSLGSVFRGRAGVYISEGEGTQGSNFFRTPPFD